MAAPAGLSQETFRASWMIAAGDCRRPIYWSGAGWSGNPRHAVLMVRREDARRVADNLGLLGPEWGIPAGVRPEQAVQVAPAAMIRGLGNWRLGHGTGKHASR